MTDKIVNCVQKHSNLLRWILKHILYDGEEETLLTLSTSDSVKNQAQKSERLCPSSTFDCLGPPVKKMIWCHCVSRELHPLNSVGYTNDLDIAM
jgi:hypothetical protein